MATKISIDDVLESAATGVLRALDARGAAGKGRDVAELVKSGFIVDLVIRAGGRVGPIELAAEQLAKASR